MKPMRAGLAVLAVGVLTVALAGCTPAHIGTISDVAPPEELVRESIFGPWAYAVDGRLYLGIASSSSCPVVPTSASADQDELLVTLGRGITLTCTADQKLVVYELPVEEIPDHVILEFEGEKSTLEVAAET